jgi:tRNA pseudouridine32 synthase/23S rRNA pseudouridine746 synthase
VNALRIIDQNNDYVIVNKPVGMTVQRDDGHPGVLAETAELLGLEILYPVHRLDRVTSGLLLMAKTTAANRQLSMAFAEHQVQKYYLALSDRKPKKKQGWVKGDMEKARRGAWRLLNSHKNPAVTQFFSHSLAPGCRAFLLRPRTGKTHQLRVALKSLGAPILGDTLYSGSAADRTYLHAYGLEFIWRGERRVYRCCPQHGEAFAQPAMLQQLDTNWAVPSELPWP